MVITKKRMGSQLYLLKTPLSPEPAEIKQAGSPVVQKKGVAE